jgi:predicted nucleic acid-binding Zn ribbon protein
MSKAARARAQSARDRIAEQRAAERRRQTRNRMLLTGGIVVLVVVVVVVFVVLSANRKTPTAASSSAGGTVLPASVARQVTSVPASALATVRGGSVRSFNPNPVKAISGTALTSNGKPEMLYIGAEFCPYCASLRWSMAVALSRFGSFTTPLRGIHSSPTDVYPNTATLTFYKAGYTSKYLTFTPVENETVNREPLQPTTKQQQAIWDKYDANSYPFIYFGGKYIITAPIYDPQVLQGKTWAQIAAALHDPSSAIGQGALGAANYITAAICKMTGDQPASVCSSLPVSTP